MKKVIIFAVMIAMATVMSISFPSLGAAENNLHRKTQNPEVELYVTSWCPYCNKAKAYLDQQGVEYRVYDIERDPAAARRKQQLSAGRGVPFAIINGTKINGWSQQAYQAALGN